MSFVLVILTLMLASDVWWWYVADSAAKRAKLHAGVRFGLGLFMSAMISGLVLLLVGRVLQRAGHHVILLPELFAFIVFVWHLTLVPLLVLPSLVLLGLSAISRLVSRKQQREPEPPADPVENDTAVTRRAFIGYACAVVPPVATLALTGKVIAEEDYFRVRTIRLPIPNLPSKLEETVIAFVSDPHVGSFMSNDKFRQIIQTTNELDADLVLHGGDLINHSLRDLPDGIDLLRGFRARYGVYSCQGNHDCIDDRFVFERDTRRAGVGMLLDEAPVVNVRGEKVQVLAPKWAGRGDAVIMNSVRQMRGARQPDAFQILLGHHPHVFDAAAELGIPLTFAGHTHGGQFAYSKQIGVGPLMYRYWSGEYFLGNSAAVISNGVGNWFPLRINVPCEIIRVVLTHA